MSKKLTAIIFVVLMCLSLPTGCGSRTNGDSGTAETPPADDAKTLTAEDLKTFGDIDALAPESLQTSVTENHAVCAFEYNGTFYRVIASVSDEDQQAYFDIDYADEDYQEQEKKILAPLKVEKFENLSEQILSQDELDALAGKTGKELLEDGWSCSGSFNLETKEFYLNYGPFMYDVTFDGEITETNVDDFDEEAGISDLTVKSAVFDSIGDATAIE